MSAIHQGSDALVSAIHQAGVAAQTAVEEQGDALVSAIHQAGVAAQTAVEKQVWAIKAELMALNARVSKITSPLTPSRQTESG